MTQFNSILLFPGCSGPSVWSRAEPRDTSAELQPGAVQQPLQHQRGAPAGARHGRGRRAASRRLTNTH